MIYRWPLYRSGASPLPTLAAGVLTFFSTNAFSYNECYIQSGDMLAMPSLTVIEAQMRYVSGTTSRGDRSAASIAFSTANGVGNSLWIGPDEIWLMSSLSAKGATAGATSPRCRPCCARFWTSRLRPKARLSRPRSPLAVTRGWNGKRTSTRRTGPRSPTPSSFRTQRAARGSPMPRGQSPRRWAARRSSAWPAC